MVSSLSSTSISSTLSSSTLTTISTAVRHPLWRLDCKSCKTTLSEQAMLGHLAGDPDKKLFSTNLAVGVLGLPDRPVSIQCPCKFHLFACASCGSVCGYKLVQACAGCKTDRGNGHFWIFYANQVVSHWRRIKDGNYAVATAATISTASTSDTTTTTEKETTPAAAVSKGSLEDLCPQLSAVSMSQFEQSENVTHAMDKQGGGAFGEVDVVLAKCHLASVECEGDDEAEGRPMYWDDLPTWQSQAEGNVGR
ncbi:Protein fam72b [Linnemannia elongata]|nr:Protein fam72b [Linnemannia elongata]